LKKLHSQDISAPTAEGTDSYSLR